MSHAYGEVWSIDGALLGHFEYNGTSDVCTPAVRKTREEVSTHWRQWDWRECKDGSHAHEPIFIYSRYGGGFHWRGRWCPVCQCLTEGLQPYDLDESYTDGHPFIKSDVEVVSGTQ